MSDLYPPMPSDPFATSPVTKTNTLAIVSLVTGILGILSACVSFFANLIPFGGIICGALGGLFPIAALITGFMGNSKIKTSGEKGKGMALAGIITGFIGLLITCVLLLLAILAWGGIFAFPFLENVNG